MSLMAGERAALDSHSELAATVNKLTDGWWHCLVVTLCVESMKVALCWVLVSTWLFDRLLLDKPSLSFLFVGKSFLFENFRPRCKIYACKTPFLGNQIRGKL